MRKVVSFVICLILFSGCKTRTDLVTVIDFGTLRNMSVSELFSGIEMIPLETTDESLLGWIDHIEFYEDKIYVFQSNVGSGVFVFSKDGKFLSKLSRQGRGPGEYIFPMAFTIDQRGAALILDANLVRLLKYNITDFSFIQEVPLPVTHNPPISVAIDEGNDRYYFFKGINLQIPDANYHFIISDEQGNILTEEVTKPYYGFSYGGHSLFHKFEGKTYGTIHYSNEVFEFSGDNIELKYKLQFGEYSFPDEDLFIKYQNYNGKREFYSEIDGDLSKWIKYMQVSQSEKYLVAGYRSVNEHYLGIFDKGTKKSINVRLSDLKDDLGLGFSLPYPMVNKGDYFVGWLDATRTNNMIEGVENDSNPVLVFYKFKKIE